MTYGNRRYAGPPYGGAVPAAVPGVLGGTLPVSVDLAGNLSVGMVGALDTSVTLAGTLTVPNARPLAGSLDTSVTMLGALTVGKSSDTFYLYASVGLPVFKTWAGWGVPVSSDDTTMDDWAYQYANVT